VNLASIALSENAAAWKLQEYDKVKTALSEHGWDERIIEQKSHSWCQRNMARVASADTGCEEKTRMYLREKGYRWYHLLV